MYTLSFKAETFTRAVVVIVHAATEAEAEFMQAEASECVRPAIKVHESVDDDSDNNTKRLRR
jgi:hypothetical protein